MRAFIALAVLGLIPALPASAGARAADISLVLQDHRFASSAVTAPAGRRLVVDLDNRDGAAEEFDSSDLKVEEDVTPHGRTRFTIGPLKAGTYRFMGEAHPTTALGTLTVTP